jgi:hypothetical protein
MLRHNDNVSSHENVLMLALTNETTDESSVSERTRLVSSVPQKNHVKKCVAS